MLLVTETDEEGFFLTEAAFFAREDNRFGLGFDIIFFTLSSSYCIISFAPYTPIIFADRDSWSICLLSEISNRVSSNKIIESFGELGLMSIVAVMPSISTIMLESLASLTVAILLECSPFKIIISLPTRSIE